MRADHPTPHVSHRPISDSPPVLTLCRGFMLAGSMKFWLGIGISAGLLVLFLFTVNFRDMLDALADANYWYLMPAAGLYLVSTWFRTLRWTVLLHHMKPVQTRRLFPVVVVGYMANNLLPMRLGELVRSYYVSEREGISKASALVTIVIERVFDALVLLAFIAIIAAFVPLTGLTRSFADQSGIPAAVLVAAGSLPFLGAFGMLVLFATAPTRTQALLVRLAAPLPLRLREVFAGLVTMFLHGLAPLRSPQMLAKLFILSVPIWLAEAAVFFLMGYPFGFHHVFGNAWDMGVTMVLVTAVTNIGSSVPAAPGGLGLFEIITRETLVLGPLGVVDRSVAAGYAVVLHAVILAPMIVLGQVFLWVGNISLGKLSSKGQAGEVVSTGRTEPAGDA
ncbi:MAG: flippase-like domain-containing protein [SAR202 cluster bacterium]|nr:flippase-like domain-containing protein [SAR202 cluster bacterium]MQG70037.1 flippase-like domain-containing protein [SAR202 cluster bacterium]HAL47317.1 hypothetical protein [Dehalococcoidia bacterium]